MNIELSTTPEISPLRVLDLQVSTSINAGKSLLFFQLLLQDNHPTSRLTTPPLSWFDAHQLHFFLQQLATAHYPRTAVIELQDAGVQLAGSFCRVTGRLTDERTIRVAPLVTSVNQFTPFTVHTSSADLKMYASKLYHRLWESFLKG